MPPTILEHKQNYNKSDQTFKCERLYQDEDLVLLRYITDRDFPVAGRVIRSGSTTLGVYRQGGNFVFWIMLDPDSRLQGYLLHICEPITISVDEVKYKDLLLDIWQSPGEAPELLDEDELEEALRAKLIPASTAEVARNIANSLLSRLDSVIDSERSVLAAYLPSD